MAKPSKPAEYGLEAGTILLGKYRVDAILGHGGMGVVALATHLALDERVAIKFLRDDVILDDETQRRFLREAQNAVKLKSEHVARVTDVGTFESGVPYMVMEYLEGIDLGQMLEENGRVNPTLAVELLLQACVALAEAHSLGIVHRDIKPGNLFVTWRADGSPLLKILDFGISKAPIGADMQLTQTQSLLGTPAYMSPEQMRSARTADPRSDIWSLGTVLHEIVEGRRPFEAESFSEMCVKVAVDPPAPLTVPHPNGLDVVIRRALEKRPEDRYQTIAELARDLVPFARDRAGAQVAVERMTRMLGRSRVAFDRGDGIAAPSIDDQPTPQRKPRDEADLAIGDATEIIDNDQTAITALGDATRTTVTAALDDEDTDGARRIPDTAPHRVGEEWADKPWSPPAPPAVGAARSKPAPPAAAPAIPSAPVPPRRATPVAVPAATTIPGSGPLAAQVAPNTTLPGLFPIGGPSIRSTRSRAMTPPSGAAIGGAPPVASPPSPTAIALVARPPSRAKWFLLLVGVGVGIGVALFVAIGDRAPAAPRPTEPTAGTPPAPAPAPAPPPIEPAGATLGDRAPAPQAPRPAAPAAEPSLGSAAAIEASDGSARSSTRAVTAHPAPDKSRPTRPRDNGKRDRPAPSAPSAPSGATGPGGKEGGKPAAPASDEDPFAKRVPQK